MSSEFKDARAKKQYDDDLAKWHSDRKAEVATINEAVKNLQRCPEYAEDRDSLVDGKTDSIPYPQPGYNCREYTIALTQKGKDGEKKDENKEEEKPV